MNTDKNETVYSRLIQCSVGGGKGCILTGCMNLHKIKIKGCLKIQKLKNREQKENNIPVTTAEVTGFSL